MKLADLQRDFRSWLVDASDDSARRLGDDAMPGLSVYQNNYRAQLIGCLEEAFPQVRTWMGEDAFLSASITHINSNPPRAWTLDAYSGNFVKTLIGLFPDNPDLHELAWIENALSDAFVAPDAEPLPPKTLSCIDWDSARLSLTPSLMTRAATTNAESIWSALWGKKEPPESEMLGEPHGLVVWRRGYTCSLKQVDGLELGALVALRENGSFATLCDGLVERLGEADGVAKAGTLLANWIGNELIVGVEQAQIQA
jgi:hypothetical protein